MADIFREVDEEVRRDRALEFWKKYQNLLIGVAIIVVIATAGWRFWENQKQKAAEETGAKYQAALQLARENKNDEAERAFSALTRADQPGYALLARFKVAAATAVRDPAAGAKAYDVLAADAAVDPVLQDVARLRSAMLLLDNTDPADARRRLEVMSATGGPFRYTARELLAVAALKANDYENAGKWLDMLVVDQQTPPDLRQRAEALLGLVSSGKAATP